MRRINPAEKSVKEPISASPMAPAVRPERRIMTSPSPSPSRRIFMSEVRMSRNSSSGGSAQSGASQLALPASCAAAFGRSRVTGASDATKHIALSCRRSY